MAMKPPKGTLDYDPEMLTRINKIVNTIRTNALNLGAREISTPNMELTSLLLKKYGEEAETKLIYRIEKLGHEDLSLRYDLTIPLQRYMALRGLETMKRFQVGKVFRKDQPNPSNGRFREFIQADLDLVGSEEPMIPEAQIMKLIVASLDQLNFPNYCIRINFRNNLLAIIERANIDPGLFKEVCISIDKLDKKPWTYVAEELGDRGLSGESIEALKKDLDENYQDPSIRPELDLFLQYGDKWLYNYASRITFDASLARGLDYYTGLIYEVVCTAEDGDAGGDEDAGGDGSQNNFTVIAGGRYDQLIRYKNKKFLPAVGVSFGVSRLELVLREELLPPHVFKIFVVSQPVDLLKKLEIVNFLLDRDYQVQFYAGKKKNIKQINQAIKDEYQYILIYGEDGDQIKVKSNDQEPDRLCSSIDLYDLLPMIRLDPLAPKNCS